MRDGEPINASMLPTSTRSVKRQDEGIRLQNTTFPLVRLSNYLSSMLITNYPSIHPSIHSKGITKKQNPQSDLITTLLPSSPSPFPFLIQSNQRTHPAIFTCFPTNKPSKPNPKSILTTHASAPSPKHSTDMSMRRSSFNGMTCLHF